MTEALKRWNGSAWVSVASVNRLEVTIIQGGDERYPWNTIAASEEAVALDALYTFSDTCSDASLFTTRNTILHAFFTSLSAAVINNLTYVSSVIPAISATVGAEYNCIFSTPEGFRIKFYCPEDLSGGALDVFAEIYSADGTIWLTTTANCWTVTGSESGGIYTQNFSFTLKSVGISGMFLGFVMFGHPDNLADQSDQGTHNLFGYVYAKLKATEIPDVFAFAAGTDAYVYDNSGNYYQIIDVAGHVAVAGKYLTQSCFIQRVSTQAYAAALQGVVWCDRATDVTSGIARIKYWLIDGVKYFYFSEKCFIKAE